MAELLSHVLLAFAVFTIASWYVEWLDGKWIAVGLIGAILPDLEQLSLFIDDDAVSLLLNIPFNWGGLHTILGAILMAAIGATLFTNNHKRAFLVLLAGALSHLIIDLPQRYADGRMLTNLYAFPLSFRPPTPGLYVSSDRWVLAFSAGLAIVVYVIDCSRFRSQSGKAQDA